MENLIKSPQETLKFELKINDDGIIDEKLIIEDSKDYGNWVPYFGVEGRDMWIDYLFIGGGSINDKNNWRKHRRGDNQFQFSTTGNVVEYNDFENITKFGVYAEEGIHSAGHLLYGPYYSALSSQDYKFYYKFWLDTTNINQNQNIPIVTIDFCCNTGQVINSYTLTSGMLKQGYFSYSYDWLFQCRNSFLDIEARIYWHGKGKIYALQTMLAHVYNK